MPSPRYVTTAHCLARDCDWTAEGDPSAVDKAAEKHVAPAHPTATVTAPEVRSA